MTKSRQMMFLGLYALLLALLFYGLIRIFSHGGQNFFLLEGLGLLVLVILSLVAFMSYDTKWGQPLFFTVFLFYLVNLVLVWSYQGTLYVSLVLLAVLGFIISFPIKRTLTPKAVPPQKEKKEELHSMVFEEEPKEETQKTKSKSTTYSPGKYVASKNSNVYHEPKCEWAKKIEKSRQLWFDDKKDAVEKGFRKHDCVQ